MEYDNNTEDIIKDIISNREIAPSENARDRLISSLNKDRKKKSMVWLLYAVAASIVLMLCFVGAKMMFKPVGSVSPNPKVVFEEPEPAINKNKTISNAKLIQAADDEEHAVVEAKVPNNLSQSISKSKKSIIKETPLISKKKKNKKLVIAQEKREEVTRPDTLNRNLPKHFIYVTAKDMLASTVTDSSSIEINSTQKIKAEKYVESDDLLLELERQLFDEKNKGIFNKASREIKKVKEAFANRNFEKQELKNL